MYKLVDCFGITTYEDNTIQNCVNYILINNWKKTHYFIKYSNGSIRNINTRSWRRAYILINKKYCINCGSTENLTYHHVDPKKKFFLM